MSVPPPPPRLPAVPDAPADLPASWAPPPSAQPGLATRAARRGAARRGNRRRNLMIVAAILVVVLIAVGAVLALGGGGSSSPKFSASTSVDLKPGDTTLEKVVFLAPPTEFPTDVRDQILTTLGAYVDNAIVKPLRAGIADDAALTAVFDAAAVTRLAAADRGLLVDEGLPKALGKVEVTSPRIAMSALVDSNRTLVLVTASVDLTITAQAKAGVVKIKRVGSFVFAPDASGAWKITGWTMHVDRTGPGVDVVTATTIAPAPASTSPSTNTAPTT